MKTAVGNSSLSNNLGLITEFTLEGGSGLEGPQGIDDIDGGGEEHRVAVETGGMAQSDGQVTFPDTDPTEKNGIGVLFDKSETENILDLGAIDFLGPVPLERIEGFDEREARPSSARPFLPT